MSLVPRPGPAHIIITEGNDGATAAADLLAAAPEALRAAARLIRVPDPPEGAPNGAPSSLPPEVLAEACADEAEAAAIVLDALAGARMGTQLYLAGTIGFVTRLATAAEAAGLDRQAIQSEVTSHGVRRVQCVHCKHVNEEVAGPAVTCGGCGLELGVRDLYSPRIGAHIGVCILSRPVAAP